MTTAFVPRHRTAMARTELSRPLTLALEHGVLEPSLSVLDYGCGRGGDVNRLRAMGLQASGWDPVHAPQGQRAPADLVNLGFVLNVIERPQERLEVLGAAWAQARRRDTHNKGHLSEVLRAGRNPRSNPNRYSV